MKQGQIFLRLCLWYCLSNLWELKILLCESCNKNNATIQLLKNTLTNGTVVHIMKHIKNILIMTIMLLKK